MDPYRARREWLRYEGTGQRDLFRELRERFLGRHAANDGWVLDLGSGPGRFLPFIGTSSARRLALDISREMLNLVPGVWRSAGRSDDLPDRILADGLHPPLAPGRWAEVALLGNTLGFSGRDAVQLLSAAEELVALGGFLLVEIAPAPGERSRYLTRLPPASVARLLRAPARAVLARLDREGFRPEPPRHATPPTFRRFPAGEFADGLTQRGWELIETVAVAPALGTDPERVAAVRSDPKAWSRLLELEEELGHRPARWVDAAAVLVAARRPSSKRMIK